MAKTAFVKLERAYLLKKYNFKLIKTIIMKSITLYFLIFILQGLCENGQVANKSFPSQDRVTRQMDEAMKNSISHRAISLEKLKTLLLNYISGIPRSG